MMRLLTIAMNDLRLLFKERSTWVNVFGISVVLVLIVGLSTGALSSGGGDAPRVRVDVVDRDETALSEAFITRLREANTSLLLCPIDNTEDDLCGLEGDVLTEEYATERLREGISLGLVIVPEGFAEALNSGNETMIVYRSNPDASAPLFIQQAVQTATDEVSGVFRAVQVAEQLVKDAEGLGLDAETFSEAVEANAREIWDADPIRLDVRVANQLDNSPSGTQAGFGQSVPGMGSMYVMFIIFPAMAAFIQEREQWTLQRLIVSPASKADVIGGKMLARIVIGMIQYGVAFAVGAIIGVDFGSAPVALVLVMLAFVTCIAGLTLALSTVIDSEQQASAVSLLLALTLAPLGGAWWPIEIVPPFMQTLALASPVGWVMRAYHELIFFGGGMPDVLLPVGVLFGAAVVFFAVGVLRFQYD